MAAQLRELRFGAFTVMDVRCDALEYGRSAPIPAQNALLVALQLRGNKDYQIWEDGRRLECLPVTPGTVNIQNLNRSVVSASAHPRKSKRIQRALESDQPGDRRLWQAGRIEMMRTRMR